MPEPIVVDLKSAGRPLNVVGEQITVLASGAQTGTYEIFHQTGPEGSGHRRTAIRGTRRSM